MKIRKNQLRQIIKEELSKVLIERGSEDCLYEGFGAIKGFMSGAGKEQERYEKTKKELGGLLNYVSDYMVKHSHFARKKPLRSGWYRNVRKGLDYAGTSVYRIKKLGKEGGKAHKDLTDLIQQVKDKEKEVRAAFPEDTETT